VAPPGNLDDAALKRLLREREKEEDAQARTDAKALSPGPCPVCRKPLIVTAAPGALRPFVRRSALSCDECGLTATAQPNTVGWALGLVLAIALGLGGMSAIFTAQRLDGGSARLAAFVTGAVLFGGGLFLGYGVHGAHGHGVVAHKILRRRRRRAAEARGEKEDAEDPKKQHTSWFQENLEAVVVAVILALIIRHFAMEAFVIPTGSMAPTLLGDHFRVDCTNCDYPFPVSKREREFTHAGQQVAVRATCPLCMTGFDVKAGPADVFGGNKILVNKFIYAVRDPRRYEVIVFKFPERPWKNFIKRLVGLPGDTLTVVNGDLYADGELARKPDHLQEDIWIPVYDSDYSRSDPIHPMWRPWITTDPWELDPEAPPTDAKVWTIDEPGQQLSCTPAGEVPVWLSFERPVVDHYGYARGGRVNQDREHHVPDLRVRAVVEADAEGAVRLAVVEGDRVVAARFAFGSGPALFGIEIDGEPAMEWQRPALAIGTPVELCLSYADDRARLLVDGEEVLAWNDEDTPRETSDYTTARLESDVGATFTQVRIDRDIYYVPASYGQFDPSKGSVYVPRAGDPICPACRQGSPAGSDVCRRRTCAVSLAGAEVALEDHFFVMGDNSPNSEDGRKWGFVRRGHLIGKAFMVFWPVVPWEVKLIR
jgi:signal peptidase I